MIRNEAFCPTTAVKMEKTPAQQLLYLVISKLVLYWILYYTVENKKFCPILEIRYNLKELTGHRAALGVPYRL